MSTEVEFEDVLERFKLFSPFHFKLLVLFAFSGFTNSWYSANYVFVAEDVDYWCKYDCLETPNFHQIIRNQTTDIGRCRRYNFNNSLYCSIEGLEGSNTEDCREWVYEKQSFMSEFDLGCQDWKRTILGTVHNAGYMIGLLLVGPLSDKFGRKTMVIIYGVVGAVLGLGRSVTNWYWIYVCFEFLEALIGDTYSPAFTLSIEMVPKHNRLLFYGLGSTLFGIGNILYAVIAWLIPYWRNLLRALYFPGLLFLLYIFLMDESVRWLLMKGRKEEAIKIMKKAAKMNKMYISEDELSRLKCEKPMSNDLVESLKITMKSKKLLLRVLACILMWTTVAFNYYALLINSVNLEGDKYFNYGMTAAAGLVASVAIAFLLGNFNRKTPLMTAMAMTGIIFIIQSLIPKDYLWLVNTLFYIGKFFNSVTFLSIYLYTSELFPTYTRNTMHAFCSSLGRVGSLVAPQTSLLAQYWSGLPSLLVGVLSSITAIVIFFLPDTSNDALPDTVEEAEAIGKKSDDKNFATSRDCIVSTTF